MVKELLKLNLKIYIRIIILFVLNKILILKGCKKTLLFHINHVFLRFFTISKPFISLTTKSILEHLYIFRISITKSTKRYTLLMTIFGHFKTDHYVDIHRYGQVF